MLSYSLGKGREQYQYITTRPLPTRSSCISRKGQRCKMSGSGLQDLPIGPIVVPFWGSYVESYKVIPKKNYYGAYGQPRPTQSRIDQLLDALCTPSGRCATAHLDLSGKGRGDRVQGALGGLLGRTVVVYFRSRNTTNIIQKGFILETSPALNLRLNPPGIYSRVLQWGP